MPKWLKLASLAQKNTQSTFSVLAQKLYKLYTFSSNASPIQKLYWPRKFAHDTHSQF